MKIRKKVKLNLLVISMLIMASMLSACGETTETTPAASGNETNVAEETAIEEPAVSEVKIELKSGDSIKEALEQLPPLEGEETGLIFLTNGLYEYQTGAIPTGWTLEGESVDGVIITPEMEQHFTNQGSIKNITFQNISGMSNGGAIYNDGGLVENCKIKNGYADADGGGIYNMKGSVINCTFESLQGGYFGEWGTEHPSIEGSCGGGVYNNEGLVDGCTFIDCFVEGAGGGVFNLKGTVSNSTFTGCASRNDYNGGGVYNVEGTVTGCTFENCTPDGQFDQI